MPDTSPPSSPSGKPAPPREGFLFPGEPEGPSPASTTPGGHGAPADEASSEYVHHAQVRAATPPRRVPVAIALTALLVAAGGAGWLAWGLLKDAPAEAPVNLSPKVTGEHLEALKRDLESELDLGSDPVVRDLRQRLLRDPEDMEALLSMGYLHVQRREYDRARGYYLYASQVDPASLEARTHLGTVAYFLGNVEEALHHYQQVLALDKDYTVALFEMGAVLRYGKNDLPAAIETWEHFLRLDPDAEEAERIRGLVAEAKRMIRTGEWKPTPPSARPTVPKGPPEEMPWPGEVRQ
ncbi:MAG: hypothetical protein OEW11_10940 [Nitrospirota bacterium]|nr:hypothetical protein [Nitrospirota bacterium]